MDNIEKFMQLFSEFQLVLVPKQERKKQTATVSKNSKTISELQKSLKRLEREYKLAVKSFKANKITKQDLHEFEWRLFEIQEEIKRVENGEL